MSANPTTVDGKFYKPNVLFVIRRFLNKERLAERFFDDSPADCVTRSRHKRHRIICDEPSPPVSPSRNKAQTSGYLSNVVLVRLNEPTAFSSGWHAFAHSFLTASISDVPHPC